MGRISCLIAIVVLFLSSSSRTLAQSADKEKNDSSTKKNSAKRDKPVGRDKLILDLTTDQWMEVPDGIEMRAYSPGFSVFTMWDYPVAGENLSLAWGVGISSINVHHNGTFETVEDGDYVEFIKLPEEVDYLKNKSSTTYLDLGAEMRVRTNGQTPLKLMLGVRGGALVSHHHKFKDDEETVKVKDREHILPYHYGLTARLLIGKIGVAGFYSLTPLFESSQSTELVPFSIGLTFSPFY